MRSAKPAMFEKRRENHCATRRTLRRIVLPPQASQSAGAALLWFALAFTGVPAVAQQASNQPGFDPRQTERQFDARQAEQSRASRSALRLPHLQPSEAAGDSRKL